MGKEDRGRKRYSVYDAKTEMPIVIYGTARECAEAMGITKNSFHRCIMRMREGKIHMRKWAVYEDETEDLEEDVEVQETAAAPTVDEKPDLKPCPFCGGKAIRLNAFGFGQWSAECLSCYVETKRHFGSTSVKFGGEIMQQGRKEAIEAWNRRAEDGNKV